MIFAVKSATKSVLLSMQNQAFRANYDLECTKADGMPEFAGRPGRQAHIGFDTSSNF